MAKEVKLTRINIAYPQYGSQKLIEIDDEKKLRIFYDKRISEEVVADPLGEEFKGYIFKITGGFDKQGFAMKQGIMKAGRVRLLLDGKSGFYTPKRNGCRKRKSIRGCIVGPDASCINLVIVKKGDKDIEGLTDAKSYKPSRLGPKRANNIRKTFRLSPEEDVRPFVVRRKVQREGKKPKTKAPRIQRLITPVTLQRKRRRHAQKKQRAIKNKNEAAEYAKVLSQIRHEKRASALSKKRKSEKSTTGKRSGLTGEAIYRPRPIGTVPPPHPIPLYPKPPHPQPKPGAN